MRDTEVASRLLIVQTGSAPANVRARHGDFPRWFLRGLAVAPHEADLVRVDAGATLPQPCLHAGIIVTGSPAMVSERLDWSERTAAWLREAIDAGTPVLGICYGHQLIAHALGGRVDYHHEGREIGTVDIERLPEGVADALLGATPSTFRAHASHQQSVLELPNGAVRLARSAHDPNHAVRYARHVWGLQFHPEFSAEIMRDYLQRRPVDRPGNGAQPGVQTKSRPAPQARRLLRRFRDIVRANRAADAR